MSLPDPQLFIDAYKETGMSPLRGLYIDVARDHCCPLAALSIKHRPDVLDELDEEDGLDETEYFNDYLMEHTEERTGLDTQFSKLSAFMRGYDGEYPIVGMGKEECAWYELGRQVWEQVSESFDEVKEYC
jgi:hypothetical protein